MLKLERRVTHEGTVSVAGNFYSIPDTARRRTVDVHVLADEIQIYENGVLIASHEPAEGRGHRIVAPAHRKAPRPMHAGRHDAPITVVRTGDQVARRSLEFYDALARQLAVQGDAR